MTPEWHVTLSCALSFGAPMAWAVRELYLLRRGRWRPEDAEVSPGPNHPITSAPPPSDGDPAVALELPASVLPVTASRRLPRRVREIAGV